MLDVTGQQMHRMAHIRFMGSIVRNPAGSHGETHEVLCSKRYREAIAKIMGNGKEPMGNAGETNRGTPKELRWGTHRERTKTPGRRCIGNSERIQG